MCREDAHFVACHDEVVTAAYFILRHKTLGSPLRDGGVNVEHVTVAGRLYKTCVCVDDGGAQHADCFFGFMPRGNAALHKEVARRGIDPAKVVGEPDNAGRVAVAKLDLLFVDDGFAHLQIIGHGACVSIGCTVLT